MKTNFYRKTFLFDLILLTALILSACGGQATTPPTAAMGTSSPTIEPSPTSSPTPSPTPTPFPPVQIGTPLPASVLSPITAENITRLRQVAIYGERIEGVFSPDGSRMLEIHPGIVNVIDTESQKLIGHVDYQTLLGYNEDGTYFFIKDDKGYAVVTLDGQRKDLPQLDNLNQLPSLVNSGSISGTVSQDGKQVAVYYITPLGNWSYVSQIGVFTVDTGDQIETININGYNGYQGGNVEIGNIQFSPDDQYLYFNVLGGFKAAYIYRTSDWKVQISFLNAGSSLVLSPDSTLAALFLDDQIEIWDIASKKEISHINDQVSSASSFLFTPDSQKIVVLTPQKGLSVWNISDKNLLQRTTTDLTTLNSVRIDNNGQILSGSGKPIPWQYSIGPYAEFAFSSDSKEIHSAVYGAEEETCKISLQQEPTCQSFSPNPGNGSLYPYHEVMVGTDGEFYTLSGLNGVLSI